MSEHRGLSKKRVVINGAGLSGALLACLLCQSGFKVELIEKRRDPRKYGFNSGRSINLALADRGVHALELAGLSDEVLKRAVPMYGRMVHHSHAVAELHRYGLNKEKIWSINRGELACCLLDAAESAGANIRFGSQIEQLDFQAKMVLVSSGEQLTYELLVGADGADSVVRKHLTSQIDLGVQTFPLAHGYKELEIPAAKDGSFQLYPNALHIWPKGGFMCIALPNANGSFTVTLFLPHETEDSEDLYAFSRLQDGEKARNFFNTNFSDASELIENLEKDFDHNPTGKLKTLRVERWQAFDSIVLVGDAAHPMVPFHGQGMNCALEDVVTLVESLTLHPSQQSEALQEYERKRKPNAYAIQEMALENYREMRHSVSTKSYLLERDLSNWIAERYPEKFIPRYSLVTFSRVSYEFAYKQGQSQRELLKRFTKDCHTFDEIDLSAVAKAVNEELCEFSRDVY